MNLQEHYKPKGTKEDFAVKSGHLAPPMVRPNSPRPQRANTPIDSATISLSTNNIIRLDTTGLTPDKGAKGGSK